MADWFYGKDNTQHGPVSETDIQNMLSTGEIDANTIVWREGMTDWLPIKNIPELSPTSSSTSPYATPQTNVANPQPTVMHIATDGLSIAALVCGILAVISCYIWAAFGIPAVICGHMSLKKIKNSPTPMQGKGMAIAGLVCGYIGIAFQIFMIVAIALAFTTSSSSYGP